ncbi:hypothetical protein JOF56_009699 [Kibdelosporangium banguiense]|uniref:Uncharacterized protein n=1 Tax=Kibdelosporangium banguiense TaxID=1365924 RepID=A0ABS4TY55_9PSEU|nr:hypothetical protein [Kibdelosporangium banguiense]
MDSHWVHGHAGYRCRHGHTSSKQRPPDAPKILYVREDTLIAGIVAFLLTQGMPGPLSPDDAVTHLRASTTLLTYGPNGCTLEPETDACGRKRRSSSPAGELDLVWQFCVRCALFTRLPLYHT